MHVLVVDDNRDAADSLCLLLRLWGYDCRVAYDGEAGFLAACDYKPDCLILDLAMPGINGYALARKVRAEPGLNGAKLIALTAYFDQPHVGLAQEAGFDYYLVKPTELFEIEALKDMLNTIAQLVGQAEQMARQNVALANETKELIEEVKDGMKEVKQDIREIKADVRELKEEFRGIQGAPVETRPAQGESPEPRS